MPFDGNSTAFEGERGGIEAALRALTAAAASFNRPRPYLIATPERMAVVWPIASRSAALWTRAERHLEAPDNISPGQDIRGRIKREARQLIGLSVAALVAENQRREHLIGRVATALEVVCARPTWSPRPVIESFLDRAETGLAAALAYDWLHAELGADTRARVEDALRRHILEPGLEAYRDPAAHWPRRHDNLGFVSNAACLVAALALLPSKRDLCVELLRLSFASLWQAFAAFAPEGAWREGPSYWSLSVRKACLAVAALESSLGTSFGLAARPGFAATGDFALHIRGSSGAAFDFADSAAGFDPAALAWFAHRFARPTDGWLTAKYDGSHLPLSLLWADRPVLHPEAAGAPTGKVFRGHDLACFRTTWSSDPAARPVFLAIKGGNVAAGPDAGGRSSLPVHAQADAGSFVIDGARTRWITDLGPDHYDLPGYFEHGTSERPGRRWRYYRNSTSGHNTLVIDGANQKHDAPAPIIASHVGPDCKWVVFDLSQAYGAPPGTVRRGAALIGRHMLIQDEIAPGFRGAVLWAAHTCAVPVLVGDKVGHFRSGPDRMVVRVLEGPARLRLSEPPAPEAFRPDPRAHFHGGAVPLGGRIAERKREVAAAAGRGPEPLRRIEIAWPAGLERLAVLFSPDSDGETIAIRPVPLAEWLSDQLTGVGYRSPAKRRRHRWAAQGQGDVMPIRRLRVREHGDNG